MGRGFAPAALPVTQAAAPPGAPPPRPAGARLALFAALCALAFAGNVFSVPLFFGVAFVFGSLAALLAALWMGVLPGMAVAAVGGLYTLWLWGHPYSLLIFVAEAGAVGLILRRLSLHGQPPPLALADGLFWLFLGIPLALLLLHGPAQMPWLQTGLIALKLSTNGLLNAALAGAVVILTNRLRRRPASVSLREVLFSALLPAVLVPAFALTVLQSSAARVEMETGVASTLALSAALARDALDAAAPPAQAPGLPPDDAGARFSDAGLEAATTRIRQLVPEALGVSIAVVDAAGKTLAGTPPGAPGSLTVLDLHPYLHLRIPQQQVQVRVAQWRAGEYFMDQPLAAAAPGTRLLVMVRAEPGILALQRTIGMQLLVLAVICLGAALGAYHLSRRIAAPILHLAQQSADPALFHGLAPPPLPPPGLLRETNQLAVAFHTMLDSLAREQRGQEAQRAALTLQAHGLEVLLDAAADLPAIAQRLCRLVDALVPGHWSVLATGGGPVPLRVLAAPAVDPAQVPAVADLLGRAAVRGAQDQDGTPGRPCWTTHGIAVGAPGEAPHAFDQAAPWAGWCHPIPGPGGRFQGVFAIFCPGPDGPSDREAQLLEVAANLAAIALRNAAERRGVEAERDAAARALRRYNADLEGFSDLMAGYRPPHEQIRALLDFACHSLGANAAALGEIQGTSYRLLTSFGAAGIGLKPVLAPGAVLALGPAQQAGIRDLERSGEAAPDQQPLAPRPCALPPQGDFAAAALIRWTDAEGLAHLGALSFAPGQGVAAATPAKLQVIQLVGQGIASSLRERAVLDGLLASRQREIIGHLASGVAHDFNNLLGVVDINLDYLTELLGTQGQPPEVAEVLEETRLAARHAQMVTAGLLSLSRGQRLATGPTPVSAVVERFVRTLARILPTQIEVATRIAPDLTALADEALLQAALLNLCINARDAMGGRGTLGIGLTRVTRTVALPLTLGRLEPGDYVELAVSDTGVGMSAEVLGHIFQPLFSTKSSGRGTGLGLFMVREFVDRCGGGVAVETQPGQGSRFLVYLPVAAAATAPTPGPAVAQALPAPPARILLVDDDPGLRAVLCRILENHGLLVEQAVDGAAALALLEGGAPCDLVLSDIVMPRMDGIELHRRLARAAPGLPVILMTADDHQSVQAAGLPVDTVILYKPLVTEILLSRIRERLPRGP